MARDFKPSLQELTAQGGCELLANTLQGSDISARTRAAFLIRYLCNSYVDAKGSHSIESKFKFLFKK